MRAVRHAVLVAVMCVTPLLGALAQRPIAWERDRGTTMLRVIREDLQKNYYDSTYHGLDLAAHFDSAAAAIKTAESVSLIFAIIATALLPLEDSHTLFLPPERQDRVEYDWRMSMVGDTCFVTDVRPGSEAAARGLRPGDQIVAIDGFRPDRRGFWKLDYLYHSLSPRTVVRMAVRAPGDTARQLDLPSRVTPGKAILDLTGSDGGTDIWRLIRRGQNRERQYRDRFVQLGSHTLVWQMREFSTPSSIDEGMKRVQGLPALVLDLRGNPGGATDAEHRLIAHLLDRADTLGVAVRRHERVPIINEPVRHPYRGTVVILVDHASASASEIVARTLQLAGRARVIGDTTWGAVMTSRTFTHWTGGETAVYYGASISVAAYLLKDGTRLEGNGVVPDEVVLPTGADLAASRDPALARALAAVGIVMSPAEAGRLFPKSEW